MSAGVVDLISSIQRLINLFYICGGDRYMTLLYFVLFCFWTVCPVQLHSNKKPKSYSNLDFTKVILFSFLFEQPNNYVKYRVDSMTEAISVIKQCVSISLMKNLHTVHCVDFVLDEFFMAISHVYHLQLSFSNLNNTEHYDSVKRPFFSGVPWPDMVCSKYLFYKIMIFNIFPNYWIII